MYSVLVHVLSYVVCEWFCFSLYRWASFSLLIAQFSMRVAAHPRNFAVLEQLFLIVFKNLQHHQPLVKESLYCINKLTFKGPLIKWAFCLAYFREGFIWGNWLIFGILRCLNI